MSSSAKPRRRMARSESVAAASRRPRWPLLLALLVVGGLAYLLVGGDSGLLQLWGRWRQLEAAEQRLQRLEAETDSLRAVLWRVENDLEYVEKVAREEYGMSKEHERVYRLRPE